MEEVVLISAALLFWGLFLDKPRRIWAALAADSSSAFDARAALVVHPETGVVQMVPALPEVEQAFEGMEPGRSASGAGEPLGPHSLN